MRPPEFWSRNTPGARLIASVLAPLGFLHGASVARKHRRQIPYRPRPKVICVGNLTVGGSGKTPIAIAVTQMLQAKGLSVVFLSRGYGRRSSETLRVDARRHDAVAVGDEALLLAQIAPTIVACHRADGARLAEQDNADAIVMDDGHQNFALVKDLSLVIVDSDNGFGNGRILPAGPLREPVRQGLARADAVVMSGDGALSLPDFVRPVLRARLVSDRRLDEKLLIAFAGIGRPDKFFASLRAQGAELIETYDFADHHLYSTADIAMLRDRARIAGVALMTTEKDFVRLNAANRIGIDVLPVTAEFDDPAALEHLLMPLFNGSKSDP